MRIRKSGLELFRIRDIVDLGLVASEVLRATGRLASKRITWRKAGRIGVPFPAP
jgi:hypothetical protein